MKKDTLVKKAFTATLPVLAGYIVLGMGFGILLRTKGYGFFWALAMSGLIYAGSMQYVASDLMAGGASLLTAAITTIMVNARHIFYGISMIDKYKSVGRKKPYLIFALTDETYSLACAADIEDERERKRYYFLVSLFDQIYWVTGSVIGSLVGAAINFSTEGIDFVLTALFVTIFVEQWLSTKDHTGAIAGLVSSVLCLAFFGPDMFLIPSMILVTVVLAVIRKLRKEQANG